MFQTAIPAVVQWEFATYTVQESNNFTSGCLTLTLNTSVASGVMDSLGDRVITVLVEANDSTAIGKLAIKILGCIIR